MADFRKWFVALAVLVAMVGTAYAGAFQCVANAGVPARVRGEGRTELVGDLLLNCTGELPVTSLSANIQIFLSVNITSRLLETTTNTTEAILTLGDPPSLSQVIGTNVFRGVKAGDNSLLWTSIPIVSGVPIGSTANQIIRITNVRANAAQGYSGQTYIPQSITMFVTVTSSTAIPINNPTQTVGAILKGLDFAARNCKDDDSISTGYSQCSPNNSDLYGDSTKTGQSLAGLLRFTEGFDAAWKVWMVSGQNGAPLGTYNAGSESGYVNMTGGLGNGALGSSTGVASSGTRLIARFANIPAYVKIFVTTGAHPNATTGTLSGDGKTNTMITTAALVSVTDTTGTSGTYQWPLVGTGTAKCSDASSTGGSTTGTASYPIIEVPLYGGAGAATWEITVNSPTMVETIAFGVAIAYSSDPANNKPALTLGTPGTVSGNFAPISADDKMSLVSPIPRFADLPITKNLIEVCPCVTNLLFPYVTARADFNTGIAISNTSLDNSKNLPGGTDKKPYNSRAQNGACVLYHFGDKEDGTSLAKPIQTSSVIKAGGQLVYSVWHGGMGIDALPGFQGYIIATCDFHLGHGLAYISDLGAQKLAMGYLALVIPTSNGSRRSPGETLGH